MELIYFPNNLVFRSIQHPHIKLQKSI